MDFDDFAEDAATLFGLNQQEAADLLDRLEEEGFDLEEDVLQGWMPEAFEELDDITDLEQYDEPWWDESLDPTFPDDDWIDEGEEWELSAEYTDTD